MRPAVEVRVPNARDGLDLGLAIPLENIKDPLSIVHLCLGAVRNADPDIDLTRCRFRLVEVE